MVFTGYEAAEAFVSWIEWAENTRGWATHPRAGAFALKMNTDAASVPLPARAALKVIVAQYDATVPWGSRPVLRLRPVRRLPDFDASPSASWVLVLRDGPNLRSAAALR